MSITAAIAGRAGRALNVGIRLLAAACLTLVAACTGTDATLGVGPGSARLQPAQVAVEITPGTDAVYFAPIVGAPADKVTILSQRLAESAQANSVTVVPENARGLTHEIRGYFSAFSEDGSTSIIHVWDVFTPQGDRVYRIEARETVPGAASDPWTVVPAETMRKAADTLLADYRGWRAQAS